MKRVRDVVKKLNKFFDSKVGEAIMLVASVGAFLALTLSRLNLPSVWFDEGYSIYLMRYDLADLTHYTAVDVHPPLYYYLLKGWTSLFGNSVVACRLLSVVLGAMVLILVYLLIKKLFTRKSASLATLLVAISPMFVRYGIEARMYMLVLLIAILAVFAFYNLLHTGKRRWAVAMGVLMSLGMWTHYFTAMIWLSFWVYRFIYFYRRGLRGKKLFRSYFDANWIIAHVVAIGLYLPWIPVALKQTKTLTGGFWIGEVNISTLPGYLSEFFTFSKPQDATNWLVPAIYAGVVLVLYLIYKAVSKAKGSQRDNLMLVITMAVAPVVILTLLSLPPFKPVFVSRYVLFSAVLLAITIALGLSLTKAKPILTLTTAVVVIGLFCVGDVNVYRMASYDNYFYYGTIKDIMAQVKADEDGDLPIITPENYAYYEAAAYEDGSNPVRFLLEPLENNYTGSLMMQRDDKFGLGIEDLDDYLKQNNRVWLIDEADEGRAELPDIIEGEIDEIKTITVHNPYNNVDYCATLYQIG